MAHIWKERFDPLRHRDYMAGYHTGGLVADTARDNLIERWVYFVRVASFTFQFHSITQIDEARVYFEKKVHPARREPGHELEHYWQRWFERLPPGLQGGSKRPRIVKALSEAVATFKNA